MFVDFNILNQLGSPSINSNTFANRPAAGQTGRLFVSTDTFEIYRDNGTGWDLIGGPGSSTVTGSGAAGQVTYWTGTNTVSGENALFWDAANNRLGINTATPTAPLDVHSAADVAMQLNGTGATPTVLQQFLSAGVAQYELGYNWNASADYRRFSIYDTAGAKEVISIDQQSRYVGINYQYSSLSDQPAYTLDVSGSGRFADSGYFVTSGSGNVLIGSTTLVGTAILQVTGNTYITGRLGVGSAANASTIIRIAGSLNGNVTSYGIYNTAVVQSDVTATAYYYRVQSATAAASFTLNSMNHFYASQGTFGIGSVVNEQIGFQVDNTLVGATTNKAFASSLSSGANRWNLYISGTATNYLQGNTLIGTTTDAGQKLQVNGTALINDNITLEKNSANNRLNGRGTVTISALGGTQNFTLSDGSLVLITDVTTGKSGLFFTSYESATTDLLSDPSGIFANTVTALKISLTKTANSSTGTITNNTTNTSFTVFHIGTN